MTWNYVKLERAAELAAAGELRDGMIIVAHAAQIERPAALAEVEVVQISAKSDDWKLRWNAEGSIYCYHLMVARDGLKPLYDINGEPYELQAIFTAGAENNYKYDHALVQLYEQQKWSDAHPECTVGIDHRTDEEIIIALGRTPGENLTEEDGTALDSETAFRQAVHSGMNAWWAKEAESNG